MTDTYLIKTKLEGYIRVGEPGGKYENCCFSFRLDEDTLENLTARYNAALDWAKGKINGRFEAALPKWEEDGMIKYSYGGPESSAPLFAFVDNDGKPLSKEVASKLREGTEVVLALAVKPYVFGKKGGLSLKVLGGRVLKPVFYGEEDPIDQEDILGALMAFDGGTKPAVEEEEDDLPF